MDWFDEYLNALSDPGKTMHIPPDQVTWNRALPNQQQKRMINDSIAFDQQQMMKMIQEARQAEIDQGMGGGYDAGSAAKEGPSAPPEPLITITTAYNSAEDVVGTVTGNIPNNWVQGSSVTSVIFANDNSVTSIGSYAFYNNQLSTVTIPNSVTTIGDGAFFNNQLSTVTIPNSVTTIGSYAFGNNQLSTVTIPNSVTSIGSYAFDNNQLSTVTIPNSVSSIEHGAFYRNQLSTVTIPNSVTSIGSYAFSNNNSLTLVNCYTTQTAFVGDNTFAYGAASPLTIHARAADGTWTAGTGLSFQGNDNVTVIKDL